MIKFSRQIFSFWNILFFLALVWVFYKKVPLWIEQYKSEGNSAAQVQVLSLDSKSVTVPIPNQKQVLIFWATWCGPCGVELARLNHLVENGTLKTTEVIAISIMEEAKIVKDIVQDRGYQFMVLLDPSGVAANQYKVDGTPTIIFVDETGKINWMTTGLSPSLEFRVKKFFGK